MTQPFACGTAFAVSVLDSLMSTVCDVQTFIPILHISNGILLFSNFTNEYIFYHEISKIPRLYIIAVNKKHSTYYI